MRQSGRTMIETLAVLAIMGILTTGAITMFNKSRRELARVATINEIADLSDNIKTLFQGKENYRELDVDYLIENGALKANRNAQGKEFIIETTNSSNSFIIIYDGLSEEDCYFYGLTNFPGASFIEVNDTSTQDLEKTSELNCKKGNINKLSIHFD